MLLQIGSNPLNIHRVAYTWLSDKPGVSGGLNLPKTKYKSCAFSFFRLYLNGAVMQHHNLLA